MRRVDLHGVAEAGIKVVVDCAGGAAALVLPTLLGRVGVDVLTVNSRLDDMSPTETLGRAARATCIGWASSSLLRAAFGVRFDPVGERIAPRRRHRPAVSDDRVPSSSCSTWSPPSAGAGGWPCR